MSELPEEALYEGVTVDVEFAEPGPTFGDLFPICGEEHRSFPPTGNYHFDQLADLLFTQVDDYFGVRTIGGEGDDVAVWLYPMVSGEAVYHHDGPFDAVRLDYCVLRNPVRRVDHFLRCVEAFAALGRRTMYRTRLIDLGPGPDLRPVRTDIDDIVAYWETEGVTVGSDEAMLIDY